MHRTDVSFPSGDSFCAGWHYTPDGHTQDAPGPIIVLGHGIAGVKEQRLDAFAERFTEAGYSCLVFDYRHFGASGGEPRELLDVHRQRQDWKAAVARARTLPGADPDRVVVWGTSFGAGTPSSPPPRTDGSSPRLPSAPSPTASPPPERSRRWPPHGS